MAYWLGRTEALLFSGGDTTVHPERRCEPRYPVAVEIKVDNGSGMTANFSGTGVYFETRERLSADDEITIVFPFHHAVPGARASCSARVLRVDQRSDGIGVAASYEAISFEVT
jgi:hypothetical protein